jgi:hypothetical protein
MMEVTHLSSELHSGYLSCRAKLRDSVDNSEYTRLLTSHVSCTEGTRVVGMRGSGGDEALARHATVPSCRLQISEVQ